MAAEAAPRRAGRWPARTVRARATWAAALVFGLALLAGAVGLHLVLEHSLIRSLDQGNRARALDVAAQVQQGTLPSTLSVAHEEGSLIQVVDAAHRVVAASPNLEGEPPIASLTVASGATRTVSATNLPLSDGDPFRITARSATGPHGAVTVYVATALTPARHTLATVDRILLVGAPVLVAIAASLTWVLVGRSLRPVESIRAQVQEISAGALDLRVPEPATDDEVGRLARTMNSMLARLEAATAQQRRFVGDASHELQSPLTSVRAGLDVALAHPELADWPTIARGLRDESERMEHLLRDLLFLARTDEARPRAALRPIDLDDTVLEEVRRSATTPRVAIDASRVSGALVLGRSEDLGRVVRNLLDNAQRFAWSTVAVGLQTIGDRVELTVEDDGPGVPASQRERIFDRFARLDAARARADGGTGLGLAIAREIVVAHGGRIEVTDASSGGARFLVTLPAAPTSPGRGPAAPANPRSDAGTRATPGARGGRAASA